MAMSERLEFMHIRKNVILNKMDFLGNPSLSFESSSWMLRTGSPCFDLTVPTRKSVEAIFSMRSEDVGSVKEIYPCEWIDSFMDQ